MIWILALLIVLFAAPFAIERLRPQMTATLRTNAPGHFAKLSQGVTHFKWYGKPNGRLVVLIHGLTTPSFVWGGLAKGLSAAGYHVLTYDLYGRGYSDRPEGPQDRAFFLRQLNDLLEHENVEGEMTVVGYSMGGAVAAIFASTHPDRVRELVLLAPAGMQHIDSALYRFIRERPVIGDWLFYAAYPRVLLQGLRAEKDMLGTVPGIGDLQRAELRYRGFLPAVLSSVRNLLPKPLVEDHAAIAAHEIPVLAVWAREDDVISITAMDQLSDWNAGARQEVVETAGHGLTYTHTDEVLSAMETFLSQQPKR